MTTREMHMYRPLGKFLERNGYEVGIQVKPRVGSPRIYDVVGVRLRGRTTAVIEAKLDHFRRTYEQAALRLFVSDYVYVSFPVDYARWVLDAHSDDLRAHGLGLLSVDGSRVRELLPAIRSHHVSPTRRSNLIRMVRRIARKHG